jgi:prophage regulatory protein
MSTFSERLLRQPAVLAQTGLKRSALYDKIRRGEFSRPIRIGKRAVAWPESAVVAWINERIASAAALPMTRESDQATGSDTSREAIK